MTRSRNASIGAAVVAAIAASSCCIGPLLFAALGIGGAGAFATIAIFRPWILGATVIFLGAGFYLTYRKPRVDDACGCEPKPARASKIGLWIATVLVVLFFAAPSIFEPTDTTVTIDRTKKQVVR